MSRRPVTGFPERLIIYRTTDRSTPCWIIRGSSVDHPCIIRGPFVRRGEVEKKREREREKWSRLSSTGRSTIDGTAASSRSELLFRSHEYERPRDAAPGHAHSRRHSRAYDVTTRQQRRRGRRRTTTMMREKPPTRHTLSPRGGELATGDGTSRSGTPILVLARSRRLAAESA